MIKLVSVFATAVLVAGAGQAGAQGQTGRHRDVIRELVVSRERVERYLARDQREQREEQTERITRTLKIGTNGELQIGNISGNIAVTRGGGNEASVEIIKTARARSSQEAKEFLGLVQVDITERGSRADIKTRYPHWEENRRSNRRNINVSVAITVAAPANTRVTVNSISGDVTAKDIKGDLTLETISGNVRIANGGRVAAAKSISGNVEIMDTEIEGLLEASSVSGNVLLRNLKARRLDVGSVSGNVMLQEVECDRVEAQSVSGDAQFAGPLARSGRYELSSHSGNVHFTVAGNTGFEVEATSFSGSVRADNISINVSASDTSRGRRQRSLRGVFGDGSAVLDLTTFSGNIVITKR